MSCRPLGSARQVPDGDLRLGEVLPLTDCKCLPLTNAEAAWREAASTAPGYRSAPAVTGPAPKAGAT